MSKRNVGDIPAVTADEDPDPDVLIAEAEVVVPVHKSARQKIEDLKEAADD
jgi:hypothetical protein